MKIEHNGTLMRIYVQESAQYKHQSMLAAIVEALAADGFTGTTAFKGMEGFGASGTISADRVVEGTSDLPIVIEVVDEDQKIRAFIPKLETILNDGLVTLERVQTFLLRTPASP